MTDITDQDLCKALAWAEGSMARGGADAAARYILATVDAPPPTLAEELRALNLDQLDESALDYLADRAEQIEQERDDARAEVERLTAERDDATVAREENVAADQQANTQETLSGSLPDHADVKPGEAWIVDTERYGRAVAFRSEDGQGSPWKFASKISTGRLLDCAITLVSRLMPAPRQITTRGELNALPRRTVIRDKDGVVCERTSLGEVWYSPESTTDQTHYITFPATVLWTPEVTK